MLVMPNGLILEYMTQPESPSFVSCLLILVYLSVFVFCIMGILRR